MIKSENGKVKISGAYVDVMADYASLIRQMRVAFREKGFSDDEIDKSFKEAHEIADLTSEELAQKRRELEVQMIMKLLK